MRRMTGPELNSFVAQANARRASRRTPAYRNGRLINAQLRTALGRADQFTIDAVTKALKS